MLDQQAGSLLCVDLKIIASKIAYHPRVAQFIPGEMHLCSFILGLCVIEPLQTVAMRAFFVGKGFVVCAIASCDKGRRFIDREVFRLECSAKTSLKAVV